MRWFVRTAILVWCVSCPSAGVVACTRHPSRSEAGKPDAASSTATADAAYVNAPSNDGRDFKTPVLAPEDAAFVDTRRGWGWSDRCWKNLHAGLLGFARAECEQGLQLPNLDRGAKAALLYNQGLVHERGGDLASARVYFEKSLTLRGVTDAGRKEVTEALVRVGGKPQPTSFPCGGARCGTESQICCDDGHHSPLCIQAENEPPEWCAALNGQRSCDPKTNEPCGAGEKCCFGKIGRGPLSITQMCQPANGCLDWQE
jgi:hypothetical protein